MQKLIFTFAIFATLAMSSSLVEAQRPGGGGGQRGGQRGGGPGGPGGQRGGQPPVSPLMTALDADKDGKLSAEEIANAAKALVALDKNEDGVLDTSELAPARGGRGGGQAAVAVAADVVVIHQSASIACSKWMPTKMAKSPKKKAESEWNASLDLWTPIRMAF